MQLENELAEAAAANLAARAIKLEQRLEDEILTAAVATLRDPNPERRAARMAELGEMVKRDKRTVEAITGLLGASGSASAGVASAAAGVASAGATGAVRIAGAGVNAVVSTVPRYDVTTPLPYCSTASELASAIATLYRHKFDFVGKLFLNPFTVLRDKI